MRRAPQYGCTRAASEMGARVLQGRLVHVAVLHVLVGSWLGCQKVGFVSASPGQSTPPGASAAAGEELKPWVDCRLAVPFPFTGGGRLEVWLPPEGYGGEPVEAFLRLSLVRGRVRTELRHIEQLERQVVLRTKRDALAFCRLFTSPTTFYLWEKLPKGALEVVSAEQADDAFFFGDRSLRHMVNSMRQGWSGSGWYGILDSREEMRRLGLQPATVRAVGSGWEVRRALIDRTEDGTRVYRVSESVTRSGKYRRKVFRVERPRRPCAARCPSSCDSGSQSASPFSGLRLDAARHLQIRATERGRGPARSDTPAQRGEWPEYATAWDGRGLGVGRATHDGCEGEAR